MNQPKSKPKIFAHRGSAILAPENTRQAFDLAIKHQADILETDIRTSSDKIPVLFHDAKLDRTTNGEGFVSNYSLAELKKLDAAYHFKDLSGVPKRGEGIEIITLAELLDEYRNIPINIEIKHPVTDFAATVAEVIRKAGRVDDVTVASFHDGVLTAFRKQAPNIRTSATSDEIMDLYTSRNRLGRWLNWLHERVFNPADLANNHSKDYQTLQVPVSFKLGPFDLDLSSEDFIAHIHANDLSITYWTINSAAQMAKLANQGADGLVTDRVDIAEKIFKS